MKSNPRVVYQQGDHVCTLYSTPEEQLAVATEYIRGGLDRGERCLYIVCEHDVTNFRNALRASGIDVDHEEGRGALVLLNKWQGHLEGGSFSAERMIGRLREAVKQALDDGFAGLCAGGDMSWTLDEAPGSEELVEYEFLLNAFYREHRALGLCLYNRRTLPSKTLDHGLATHSTIRIEGPILLNNPFYEKADALAMSRIALPDPAGRFDQVARA